jgi:hypothetical protein
MAIATKRRRKIEVDGRAFVWWVTPDDESNEMLLRISSTDKQLLLCYIIDQPDESRHVIVLGRELPPLTDAGGRWIRLHTPRWDDRIVTPKLVRTILLWALDPFKEVVRVGWSG